MYRDGSATPTTRIAPVSQQGTAARQALRYAIPLAQRFSAKIILLHVIQPYYGSTPESAGLLPIPPKRAQQVVRRLEETAAKLVPKDLRGRNVVRMGSPYGEIVAAARRLDVGMIVLTTHGRTGLKRFFLGSTVEQVVRHAPCSVLSVRRQ